MIRQFFVEQGEGKPYLTGILLLGGDIEEADVLKLGERLARLNEPARGTVDGIRWKYVPTDHPTPGLEYITVVVPHGTPAASDSGEEQEEHPLEPLAACIGVKAEDLAADLAAVDYNRPVVGPTYNQVIDFERLINESNESMSAQVAETLLGSPNPPVPPDPVVDAARARVKDHGCDIFTDLIEQLADVPYRRNPEMRAAAYWARKHAETAKHNREDAPVVKVTMSDGRRIEVAISDDERDALSRVVERAVNEAELHPAGVIPDFPEPCRFPPTWLWPLVAIVGLVIVIAGVR
jgi:hypothetical protein